MSWPRMIIFNFITLGLLILCNSLRSTLLYAPESGMFNIPGWLHEGVGILCYIVTAAILIKLGTTTNKRSHIRSTASS